MTGGDLQETFSLNISTTMQKYYKVLNTILSFVCVACCNSRDIALVIFLRTEMTFQGLSCDDIIQQVMLTWQ